MAPAQSNISASKASGAMLSGYGETTRSNLQTKAGLAKINLRIDAAQYWQSFVEKLEISSDNLIAGTVMFSNAVSGPVDEENWKAIIELLQARHEPFESINSISDLGVNPSEASKPSKAIFIPQEQGVDSAIALRSLFERVNARQGFRYHDDTCGHIQEDQNGFQVQGRRTRLEANKVIIAAGATSHSLLSSFSRVERRVPPLFFGVGVGILGMVENLPSAIRNHVFRTPNRAFSCGLHSVPRRQDGVYIGATNNILPAGTKGASLSDVEFVADCAMRQIDNSLSSMQVTKICVGNRPVPLDTYPLIGETSVEGLWLATGTYRDGFLLAPLIARRLSEALLSQQKQLVGCEMFTPEREPISELSQEEAITEGVKHYLSIAFERGTELPTVGNWRDEFEAAIRLKVESLYQAIDSDYVLPPDFLWDIDEHGLVDMIREKHAAIQASW